MRVFRGGTSGKSMGLTRMRGSGKRMRVLQAASMLPRAEQTWLRQLHRADAWHAHFVCRPVMHDHCANGVEVGSTPHVRCLRTARGQRQGRERARERERDTRERERWGEKGEHAACSYSRLAMPPQYQGGGCSLATPTASPGSAPSPSAFGTSFAHTRGPVSLLP
jgi:hypothetical protein